MIRSDELREYADLLEASGFAIYEPTSGGDYFMYSRVVDGQECFGQIARKDRPLDHGYEHHMPIKPSQEFGSRMFVEIRTESTHPRRVTIEHLDEMTVRDAMLVARPENWNSVVGVQKNYSDPAWNERLLNRRSA